MGAINSEETLQMAAEAAGVGTWDLDVASMGLHSSPRCREIFGFSTNYNFTYEDFVGVLHPDDRAVVLALIDRATDPEGPGSYDTEYRVHSAGSTLRWIAARGKAYFAGKGAQRRAFRFIGTVIDRTEQKRAQEALIESEKLAVTGRLVAAIAHEIRNPLHTVGELLYLVRESGSRVERDTYLDQAHRELATIATIANSTLRLHRDSGDGKACELGSLVESVLVMLHGRIGTRRIQVEAELPNEVCVAMPQGEMRQVLLNLVGNALDALTPGGRLKVRLREIRREDGTALVRVSVADNGQGMSPVTLQHLFEPFYTTKGEAGNGIGLWLSREILRKHESQLRVRSQQGKGSVFLFSVPAASRDAHYKAPQEAAAEGLVQNTYK